MFEDGQGTLRRLYGFHVEGYQDVIVSSFHIKLIFKTHRVGEGLGEFDIKHELGS